MIRAGKKSPYTWEQIKVLYKPAVGENRVADELKEKYRVAEFSYYFAVYIECVNLCGWLFSPPPSCSKF